MELSNATPTKKGKKSKGKLITTIIAVVIILAIGGAAGYVISKKVAPQTADQASKQEIDSLVAKVSKLMTLPGDETPSVATVTDKAKLADQPFFAKSENGDKVLIYTKGKKAILFRPSTDKIIEVMPISFTDTAATDTTAKPAETPVKK